MDGGAVGDRFGGLLPGRAVSVVKLEPGGVEVARYPAVVIAEECPAPWFAVEARWVMRPVEVYGLVFQPGDTLIEYFSPGHWFNTFRVIAPDGSVRGVYGNVTRPAGISSVDGDTVVTWHDLYLDVVRLADGSVHLCDEEELEESALRERDPELHRLVMNTARDMIGLATGQSFPFHVPTD